MHHKGPSSEMGSRACKGRKPSIWQDEMVEVRQLFRRVDQVRRSGFTGFSTWETPRPSADTLSRNRLRRRRALCSLELSHLNYKEAPFESISHLQNIQGMCTRIQRQDCAYEKKKKYKNFVNGPPLLRRPLTSASVERRRRKQLPFKFDKFDKTYSASTMSPQNININKGSIHHLQGCTSASKQHIPKLLKSIEDVKTYEQVGINSNFDSNLCNSKDQSYSTRPKKPLRINTNMHAPVKPLRGGIDYSMAQTSNLESEEKSIISAHNCGWSITDEITTPNIYPTSASDCKLRSSNHISTSLQNTQVASGIKGIDKKKTSFIQPISNYCNILSESKSESRHFSPSSTLLNLNNLTTDKPKTPSSFDSFHKSSSTLLLDANYNIDRNNLNRPFKMLESTSTTESRWLTTTSQKPPHKSADQLDLERNGIENVKIEDITNIQDATTVSTDDANVLIKHSSDPYSDFRSSMVSMIEEEGLQDRQAELEELFQYYLDLNPKVHHEVLHKVIRDIRLDYLIKNSF